jgi:hypothetical protein
MEKKRRAEEQEQLFDDRRAGNHTRHSQSALLQAKNTGSHFHADGKRARGAQWVRVAASTQVDPHRSLGEDPVQSPDAIPSESERIRQRHCARTTAQDAKPITAHALFFFSSASLSITSNNPFPNLSNCSKAISNPFPPP